MRSLFLILVACAGPALGAPAAPPPPRGHLVIIGGHLEDNNAEVWRTIVALAGGRGAHIAVLPSAAADPNASGAAAAARLNQYGAHAFVVPVSVQLRGRAAAVATADDVQLAQRVARAGGAFFVGGDQSRITAALRRPDGQPTRVLDALWSLYRTGGVLAGTSAGAAIMSRTMYRDAESVLGTLSAPVRDGYEVTPGLGFIGDDVFIDQHMIARGRFARMLPAMLAGRYTLGLGVDENTALVVEPTRAVRVIGASGAIVLDLTGSRSQQDAGGLRAENVRISYADAGDTLQLPGGDLAPGQGKRPVDAARPYFHGSLFTPDILGRGTVVDLMTKLVDSDQQRGRGLAFGDPAGAGGTPGFEFTFTRTPETRAWLSNVTERYSVYRLRMDVQPVRMATPLYAPLEEHPAAPAVLAVPEPAR
ncbi:cyanophycinase [Massilia arenosa]|uniref:Cyanophycinase n=1 Tax=Zemynaea arenosa TaxID=2561931 RepID=A0A4Y9SCB9_9BURK|nr:cyanophycinase [Massilia arenosa]TFW20061.1 cyanophycinase [Massilia arenosa]